MNFARCQHGWCAGWDMIIWVTLSDPSGRFNFQTHVLGHRTICISPDITDLSLTAGSLNKKTRLVWGERCKNARKWILIGENFSHVSLIQHPRKRVPPLPNLGPAELGVLYMLPQSSRFLAKFFSKFQGWYRLSIASILFLWPYWTTLPKTACPNSI